jgi:hypothetical protein
MGKVLKSFGIPISYVHPMKFVTVVPNSSI